MPLDTGAFAEGTRAGQETLARRPRLVLEANLPVGAALAAMRLSQRLSLDEISETTRVRVRHLEAIEAGQIDQLPSRPFTVGYVRAYAQALGLDVDATASRFRSEFPSPDDELHGPVGVRHNRPRRSGWIVALVGVLVVAVVGWNVTLHVLTARTAKSPAIAAPHAEALARANSAVPGPFSVNTPLPAPPEATAPAPYITPVAGANDPTNAVAATTPPQTAPATPFEPQGEIFGAAKGASSLIIQAKKSISLEVRGPGGVVYFARQLAAGEAYRVPALPDLTAEVSNPASAELFEAGVSKGTFTQPQMPLKTIG